MNAPSIAAPKDQSVTFVELFFDLVFVFSITQVVAILHGGITWEASARVLLVFWLIWWAWTQFTWALNAANTDHAAVQLLTLFATAVAFFMAVSVPAAFQSALWFAVPYVLVRLLGLLVYSWAASSDAQHLSAVRTFALVSVGGLAAVMVGAVIGGDLLYWFWGLAIVLDVIAAGAGARLQGWNLHSGHFVERHGLIVIIALGESLIVAAGGLVSAPRELSLILVAIIAVALTCTLWWSYFPYLKPALEEAMEASAEKDHARLARDVFSLAHFPMLCGIIAIAAVTEEAIAHPDHALPIGGRMALAAGTLLFLGGAGAAHWRASGGFPTLRTVVVTVFAVVVVFTSTAPAWVSLGIACGGAIVVVIAEEWSRRKRPAPASLARS